MSDYYPESVLRTLQLGEISLQGQFNWSSNYTFLVGIQRPGEGESLMGVYKPARGERPLWDFPPASLAHRETAAYLVSEALAWHLVPPTFYRKDAPLEEGSVQLFINHNPEHHYFTFTAAEKRQLKRVVLFDLLVNNADRKGGHILVDDQGRIWLIDHGICFHEEEKIRTVIWDFAGRPIPTMMRRDLARFADVLTQSENPIQKIREHLNENELEALGERARFWSRAARFPDPPPGRRAFPYPPV